MSFLDLYSKDQNESLRVKPNEASNLPVDFADGIGASWNYGKMVTQSNAGETARSAALQDHIAKVRQDTGIDLEKNIDWSAMGENTALTADVQLEQINSEAEKNGAPKLSLRDLEKAANVKSLAAQSDYQQAATREQTFGGKIGMFLGGAGAAASDPINLLALPVAPEMEGIGLLSAALRWGAVGAASQAAITAVNAPYRLEIQPDYIDTGGPVTDIAGAAAGGFVLGGITKGLANAWTRVKTGAWPTSIRDAGNIIESEANVAETNVYPGVAGEVAHREALTKTIDDVAAGRPPDVDGIITPELRNSVEIPPPSALSQDAEQPAAKQLFENLPPEMQGKSPAAGDMSPPEAPHVPAAATELRPEVRSGAGVVHEVTPDVMASPDYLAAVRADIDRERMMGDRQFPHGVDERGQPMMRSLDEAMNEVDGYKLAADHIQACAAPAPAGDAA